MFKMLVAIRLSFGTSNWYSDLLVQSAPERACGWSPDFAADAKPAGLD